MTEDPKKKVQQAAQDIDLGLNGLFGALGDAIGGIVSKLEEGNSGAVVRDHVFGTEKGPVRAHAGVRVQMGGLDVGGTDRTKNPKPINPGRAKPCKHTSSEKPPAKDLEYDLFEDNDAWIFTSDLPGVARKEVSLKQDGRILQLITTGPRHFQARVELDKEFDLDGIETHLRNGVLTLSIPKAGTT